MRVTRNPFQNEFTSTIFIASWLPLHSKKRNNPRISSVPNCSSEVCNFIYAQLVHTADFA